MNTGIIGILENTASVNADTLAGLRKKLHPRRFPNMSGFMVAILGYMLGESYTNPEVAELMVSPDEGILYIRNSDEIGFNTIKSYADFRQNWLGLISFEGVGLTDEERALAEQLLDAVPRTPGH